MRCPQLHDTQADSERPCVHVQGIGGGCEACHCFSRCSALAGRKGCHTPGHTSLGLMIHFLQCVMHANAAWLVSSGMHLSPILRVPCTSIFSLYISAPPCPRERVEPGVSDSRVALALP